MKIQDLRNYAHELAGLPPSDKYPVLTPSQVSPNALPEHDRVFYQRMGEICVHFLNTRRKTT
jgi:hypothetical protein